MSSPILKLIGFLTVLGKNKEATIATANEIALDEALGYKDSITLKCDLSNPKFYLELPEKLNEGKENPGEGKAEEKKEPTQVLIETKEGKYNVTEETLFIEDLRGEEIKGKIICKSGDDETKIKTFKFIGVKPFLVKPEKLSITETSGGNAVFKCAKLYGSEVDQEWSWVKNDNETLVSGTGNILIDSKENSTMLTIKEVKDEDKGEYSCVLKNKYGQHSEKVNLRVKSALAALWPFLGIVAEVVILCVIILGYETRCVKKKQAEEEDMDAAQNLMGRDGAQTSDLKKRTAKA